MNQTLDEKRIGDVMVFVLGKLDELIDNGLVERGEGSTKLTDDGKRLFREMKANGFTASTEEIQAVTAQFAQFEADHALESQRDALLAACIGLCDAVERIRGPKDVFSEGTAITKARAAIALCK